MKVLFLENNLNGHSGTPKVLIEIASAFKRHGDDVDIIYFSVSRDAKNIINLLKDFNYKIIENKKFFSYYIQYLVIKLFEKGAFNENDIFGIFNQLKIRKELKLKKYDLIIAINIFSAFSFIFLERNCCKKIIYLHEAPLFSELFWPIRKILRFYVKLIIKKSTAAISISREIYEKSLKAGFETKYLTINYFKNENEGFIKKENIVLLDSRWTDNRNIFFSLKIIQYLKDLKFIIAGYFPNINDKIKYMNKINELNLNERIYIIENYSEKELDALYKKAKYVLRWSGRDESGPSLSIRKAISNFVIPIINDKLGDKDIIKNNISEELVVPLDEEKFIEIIEKIEGNPEFYINLLQRIENLIKAQNWDKYVDDLLSIIE